MAGSRAYLGACVLLASAAALGAAAMSVPTAPAQPVAGMQQALACLDRGEYAKAERLGVKIATDQAGPRAWAIVAAARQRRKQYRDACRAYRLFLASTTSEAMRAYALAQIRACEEAAQKRSPPVAPSRRLGTSDLAELARVHSRTYTESSEHFVVRAQNPRLAKLVAVEAEVALDRICRVILAGQEYPHSVRINVWPDHDTYHAHATDAPEWAGGSFSIFSRNGVTTRRIDLTQRDEKGRFAVIMLDRVLPHEMCHLVLQEGFGDTVCPLFLNEGLAMMAEAEVDNARVALAGKAIAGKAKIALDNLLVRQRYDIAKPVEFYAKSYSFVEFLHGRLTASQFRAFLSHVKCGCTVVDAVQRALYLAPEESFLPALASAWEDHAVAQAQYLEALGGDSPKLARGSD
jgi:hypothetical protein